MNCYSDLVFVYAGAKERKLVALGLYWQTRSEACCGARLLAIRVTLLRWRGRVFEKRSAWSKRGRWPTGLI